MPASEQRERAELERLAWLPCEAPKETGYGGECPDYWAIGMAKDACPPCAARDKLDKLRSLSQSKTPESEG